MRVNGSTISRSVSDLIPAAACIATVAIASFTLIGWAAGVNALTSLHAVYPRMVPNTALGLALSSFSLWSSLRSDEASLVQRIGGVCALVVMGIGAVTLIEYAGRYDTGINSLFGAERLAMNEADSFVARPSPHTALSLLLIGSSILLLSLRSSALEGAAQLLAVAVLLIASLAITGYIFHATFLYAISSQTGMALHTAIAFLLLGVGVLFARPDNAFMAVVMSDTCGGHLARRLIPAALSIPVLLGVGILACVRLELYESAYVLPLFVVASAAIFSVLIWRSAQTLFHVDAGRNRAERELRKSHGALETMVKERTAELSLVNQTLQAEVIEHKKAEAARARLLSRLVAAQEEERRRLSRELHDHMGQYLSALTLRLKTLQPLVAEHETARNNLRNLQELTDKLADEVHHLAWELRPAALDDLGLQTALQNYAERWAEQTGIEVDFHSGGLERQRLPSEIETTIYRTVQEAMNNILKHAYARRVSVILERRRTSVLIIVEDDGRGFDVESVIGATNGGRGLGLPGMHERVASVGGTLNIESTQGVGTTVHIRIPLHTSSEKEVFPREYFKNRSGR